MNRQQPIRSGYVIFCPTIFQGTMPACYEAGSPLVFPTEFEAQREIACHQMIRIQQFLDGERDFEDAITTDEFVLRVAVRPDGRVAIEDGRIFGAQS